MLLNIVRQDITKLPGNCVICHCISADAAMGAGVALALTRKYPDLKPTVQSSLRMAHPDTLVGRVAFYADSYSHTLIANMVTKRNYWDKSTSSKPLLNLVRFEPFNTGIEKGSAQPRAV